MLGTASVRVTNANPWNNQIRALCDTGSQLNLISQKAAKRMNLLIENISLSLYGANETKVLEASGRLFLELKTVNPFAPIRAEFLVVSRVTSFLPQTQIETDYPEFSKLNLADPKYKYPAEIDALFGMEIWIKALKSNVVKTRNGLAAAQQTSFGWVIYMTREESNQRQPIVLHSVQKSSNEDLDSLSNQLQRFWEIEDIPSAKFLTPEEIQWKRYSKNIIEETSTVDTLFTCR